MAVDRRRAIIEVEKELGDVRGPRRDAAQKMPRELFVHHRRVQAPDRAREANGDARGRRAASEPDVLARGRLRAERLLEPGVARAAAAERRACAVGVAAAARRVDAAAAGRGGRADHRFAGAGCEYQQHRR